MIINILGLLGSEFSKYLIVLFGAKQMIKREIQSISEAQNYETILKHVINIKNFINLGDFDDYAKLDETFEPPIDIREEFYDKYCQPIASSSNEEQNYYQLEVKTNRKLLVFNQLINEIKQLIKSENVLSFEDDRDEWCAMLNELLDNMILKTYYVNNIDELCLSLGPWNICYDKSFLKMFEILYKESFADIPYELWSSYKPHIRYIENELKLDIKCSKYLTSFNKYYHKIYDETLKSVCEKLNTANGDILNISITDEMYELLSDVTFNLFVNISKKIANNQLTYAYFGKSTRIQFIQMFQALMDCSPRLYLFTESQRMVLHYILLSKKVIKESIQIICGFDALQGGNYETVNEQMNEVSNENIEAMNEAATQNTETISIKESKNETKRRRGARSSKRIISSVNSSVYSASDIKENNSAVDTKANETEINEINEVNKVMVSTVNEVNKVSNENIAANETNEVNKVMTSTVNENIADNETIASTVNESPQDNKDINKVTDNNTINDVNINSALINQSNTNLDEGTPQPQPKSKSVRTKSTRGSRSARGSKAQSKV